VYAYTHVKCNEGTCVSAIIVALLQAHIVTVSNNNENDSAVIEFQGAFL